MAESSETGAPRRHSSLTAATLVLQSSARSASQWLTVSLPAALPMAWLLQGWTRVAVLVIFVASAAWTLFRALLNVAPNATANYLMNTTQFDEGEFWQLTDAEPRILLASVVGLGVVALVYVYLAVILFLPITRVAQNRGSQRHMTRATKSHTQLSRTDKDVTKALKESSSGTTWKQLGTFYFDLVNLRGKYRKAWNLVMDIPELVFQSITLHGMLSSGLPTPLVTGYVVLMVVNCTYSFYHITIAWKHHVFSEMVGDAMLDVVFAVVFPAITLVQSIADFRGDLSAITIRQKFLPAQPYERRGRLHCDPRQINLFTTAFETLQITSGLDLVVTVGFNLLTCLRWRRIVKTLQRHHHRRRRPPPIAKTITQLPVNSIVPVASPQPQPPLQAQSSYKDRRRQTQNATPLLVPVLHRVVPAYVGFFFLLYGAITALFVAMAITKSGQACGSLPHCALHAYQWFPGAASMACPCLVYIEGDLLEKIRASDELPDASDELALAAEAGSLRTIQLINRALQGKLPRFVQGCSELRQLIIVYGDLSALPSDWTWTFTKLTHLHVTGRSSSMNLESIPANFFTFTPSLRTLHLERHPYLLELPSFQGLSQLELLFLGGVSSLRRLPSFEHTPKLKTLALVHNDLLAWLPELTPIAITLQSLTIQDSSLCCSGFLSQGHCNASQPTCYDFAWGGPCYPGEEDLALDPSLVIGSAQYPLVSNSSLAVLQRFLDSDAACNKSTAAPVTRAARTYFSIDPCEGVWYRQCPNDDGMCYSFTDADVCCVKDPAVIEMRTTEISMHFACNATEEAWLGCTASSLTTINYR